MSGRSYSMWSGGVRLWVIGDRGIERRFFVYYRPDELDALLHSAGFAIAESWADADSQGRPEAWLSRIAA
jgi:hypothetical protein